MKKSSGVVLILIIALSLSSCIAKDRDMDIERETDAVEEDETEESADAYVVDGDTIVITSESSSSSLDNIANSGSMDVETKDDSENKLESAPEIESKSDEESKASLDDLDETTETTEAAQEIDTEAYDMADNLVKSLKNKDYDSILKMMNLPENSIVSANDIEFTLNRNEYSDFIGENIETLQCKVSGNKIDLELKTGTHKFKPVITKDNEKWTLHIEDAIDKDASVIAPGNAAIKINGIELNEDKDAEDYEGYKVKGLVRYTLTVPTKPFIATINTLFGESQVEGVKSVDNDGKTSYSIIPNLDPENSEFIENEAKEALNNALIVYDTGTTEINRYIDLFAIDAPQENIENFVSALKNKVGDIKNLEYTNLKLSKDTKSFIVSLNRAVLKVEYTIKLYDKTMNGTGEVAVENTDDGYKLYYVNEDMLGK